MEEEKDDEISLDFGKIKNFFKRKENEENARKSEISGTNSVGNPEVHAGMGDKGTEIKQESNQHIGAKQEGQTKDDDKITIDAQKSKSSGIPENSDEEFSLDFGWVKNIFKGKDPATEEKEEKAETKDDDEISIDFSKIKNLKNIFKKDKDIEFGNTEDENISLDFKKVLGFFVEHRVLIFLLIPIFLSIFLRVQPAYLPITDEWAINSVINNLKSQVSSQINQQYPNLPDQNKNALVENELQKVLREQKSQIDQQITATSNFFKSRLQDDTGQTYLLAIDPYFWMRHAQNVIKKGNPGDEIRDGQQWDNHMYAPDGRGIAPDMFHAYFEAFLFKFLSFFNKNLNLMAAVFFVPVLISALAVIPTFFITRKLVGNLGGVIAATVIAIHPSFLTRTVGGFADTDAYNVTFPLFIAWLFLEALESKSTKNSVILSTINGLLVGLYAFTWGGWWYIFDFILISIVLYIAYYTFIHKKELIGNFTGFIKQKEVKNSLIFLAIFFIVSALSTSAFVSLDHFTRFAKNPAGFARLKEVGITTIWPNVFTTVAEQNPASLDNVIKQVGLGGTQIIGTNFPIFFLISLMGITLTLTTKGHKKIWFVIGTLTWYIIIFLMDVQNLNTFLVLISIPIIIRIILALWEADVNIDIKYAIFLILWFIATTYASTKGVRFTLLLVPAFAIGFGIALGELYRYANVWIAKGLHVNKFVSKMTVMIVILLLLVPTYSSAKRTAEQEIPSFNDAWAISLEKIKSESEPNAIINSWWDFGHWFKFWADRAVTFDGTSQNTPQAHWIGKTLLTDNEDLAIGILRMLDCSGGTMPGGTKAFVSINEKTNDGTKTILILNDIIVKDKEEAKEYLRETFNEKEAEEIVSQTHCRPPENYFITSEDMVGKSGVWAHFGSWDFDRGLIYNTLKKKQYKDDLDKSIQFLQERFNYSKNDAENLFYDVQSITTSSQANNWIAPWPGYAGTTGCGKIDDVTLSCNVAGIPLIINLTTNEAYADSQQGRLHPKLILFPSNLGIILREYNESVITLQNGRQLGIALIKNGESYQAVAMDSDLTASMFTRLFYQEGIGLKHFKKFSDESGISGGRIIVWKVDWEGKEKNIIEISKPETKDEEKEIEDTINKTNMSDSNTSQNTQ